jgi:hypothetical protein
MAENVSVELSAVLRETRAAYAAQNEALVERIAIERSINEVLTAKVAELEGAIVALASHTHDDQEVDTDV